MTCRLFKNLQQCILRLRIHILSFADNENAFVSVVGINLSLFLYVTDFINLYHSTAFIDDMQIGM